MTEALSTKLDNAVRDITAIPYPAKSEIRRIILDVVSLAIEEEATGCFNHSMEAYERGKNGQPFADPLP